MRNAGLQEAQAEIKIARRNINNLRHHPMAEYEEELQSLLMKVKEESEKVCTGFSSCCFTEIDVPIDLRWVSQGISGLL